MVVKVGGSILDNEHFQLGFLEDIIFMKTIGMNIYLVHGGSRQLNEFMKSEGIKVKTFNGQRYTDEKTLKLAIKCFNKINNELVKKIKKLKGLAFGLKGNQSQLVIVKKQINPDLGFVGETVKIDTDILSALKKEVIPVITSMGIDEQGQVYNINADNVAGNLAVVLKAEKLILMTDVEGIKDANNKLISTLDYDEVKDLINKNVIKEGMIQKVLACLNAINGGVSKSHIIDGSKEHSFINEVLTDKGVGTEIIKSSKKKSISAPR